ncbi:MAG: hypothetical protein H6524_10340 [Actinobacteria bacterium]|jgi:hypothetical protein|nr:hypothetical protein [Micrococcales bacterium]MCB0903170.1 hypothetical protein [Actinomycetota bacterium]MCO5300100.1 hypothetical protein [Candidatus Nanopelagicales bacterium]MCB9429198.1 hypothetical protein [Actinomycetota bacterium]HPE11750.1 hypothetical protein [Actinomycetota bacterium]
MMRPEASNLRRWAWRVPLIVAVLAMLFAAALVSMGQRAVSDVFVTMGFAFGILSVPIWMLTGREQA